MDIFVKHNELLKYQANNIVNWTASTTDHILLFTCAVAMQSQMPRPLSFSVFFPLFFQVLLSTYYVPDPYKAQGIQERTQKKRDLFLMWFIDQWGREAIIKQPHQCLMTDENTCCRRQGMLAVKSRIPGVPRVRESSSSCSWTHVFPTQLTSGLLSLFWCSAEWHLPSKTSQAHSIFYSLVWLAELSLQSPWMKLNMWVCLRWFPPLPVLTQEAREIKHEIRVSFGLVIN